MPEDVERLKKWVYTLLPLLQSKNRSVILILESSPGRRKIIIEGMRIMSQDDRTEKLERRNFFISYAGQDKPWAEWIAAQLDAAGYTVFLQAWDVRPGSNIVVEIDHAIKQTDCTLLVLSAAFLTSGSTFSAWAADFHQDSTGRERRLLPVRIEPCEPTGLLAQIEYLDLVGYDAEQARERLLKGIQKGRVRPRQVVFPGPRVASVAFPGAFPAHWNLPFARNPFFTGREELLQRLHRELGTTQTAVALSQPQAISGLGGVGKTQLAIEYAYRYRVEYQAVLWVRAETTEALNASYRELAALLGLPEQGAQEQEVVVQAVKRWLRQNRGWLLILDNADDLSLVQPFVPTGVVGHLIFTTRTQITGRVAKRLEVDSLDVDVGALFLLRRSGLLAADAPLNAASDADQAAARALSRDLGGLPLALDQAGAYIEETACSLSNYQQQYQKRRAYLLARRGAVADDYPESVATTWSLSFARVEQASPLAAELLRACAFLAPDAIPEELLAEVLKTPPASLEPGEQQQKPAPQSTSGEEIQEVVAILRAYSLLERNTAEKMVRVHRLVQAVVRDALEESTQHVWMARVVRAVEQLFPPVSVETWELCERYLPQALAGNEWITHHHIHLPQGASLLHRAGWYLHDRARYAEAEPLYVRALAIYEQELGGEHPDTATTLNNLAGLYRSQGKYAEAEPLYMRALAIREQELGGEHPDTATSLNNLALLYANQGKYAEAEPLYVRALAIYEQELGAEHPSTANSLNNLALLYKNQGKYAEAEPLYVRALTIRERQLGAEHPSTANSLNNLADLYDNQGKYTEAEALLMRALAIREQELGAEHPSTANSLNNLADLYHTQGKYAEAEPLYVRALAIREQQLGGEHPDIATSLNNLAGLYRSQGKYGEAEALYVRALAICENILGQNHTDTQTARANYTALLQAMKPVEEPGE